VTVFAISAGDTSLLTSLHYPPPEAGVVLAVGAFGFLAGALLAVRFAERLERKLWLPIGATITVVGSVLDAFLVIAGFLVVAAVIAQFALNMRDRRLRSSRPEVQPSHVLGQQLALPPASRRICLLGAPARVRRFTEDVVRASATATLS